MPSKVELLSLTITIICRNWFLFHYLCFIQQTLQRFHVRRCGIDLTRTLCLTAKTVFLFKIVLFFPFSFLSSHFVYFFLILFCLLLYSFRSPSRNTFSLRCFCLHVLVCVCACVRACSCALFRLKLFPKITSDLKTCNSGNKNPL